MTVWPEIEGVIPAEDHETAGRETTLPEGE